jgi:hypothetical protein
MVKLDEPVASIEVDHTPYDPNKPELTFDHIYGRLEVKMAEVKSFDPEFVEMITEERLVVNARVGVQTQSGPPETVKLISGQGVGVQDALDNLARRISEALAGGELPGE